MDPFDYRLIPYTQTVADTIMFQQTDRYPLPITEEDGDLPPLRRMRWLWRLVAVPEPRRRTRRHEEPVVATPVTDLSGYRDF